MTQHIDLRGSSYISTPDVNVLDADTAHLYQSEGQWSWGAYSAAVVDESRSTSGKALRLTATGDYQAMDFNSPASQAMAPVSASTQYTFACTADVQTTNEARVVLRVSQYNSSNGLVSQADYNVDPASGGVQTLYKTLTTAATAVKAAMQIQLRDGTNAVVAGDTVTIWDIVVREGSDATFVPSQRIVGDLDLRAKVALPDVTPAADVGLMNRYQTTGNKRVWRFKVTTAGQLQCVVSDDGTNTENITSDNTLGGQGYVAGDVFEARVTLDESASEAEFYVDDVSFGATESYTRRPAYLCDAATKVGCGFNSGSEPLTGRVYWAEVRDGIDGPVVARFDASTLTEADVTAGEVTQ